MLEEAIEVTSGTLRVLWMEREEYFRMTGDLSRPTGFSEAYPFDTFIDEKRSTEDRIRAALSSYWVDGEDFEVASDTNRAFTLCGGVYSPRIVCRDYLDCLCRAVGPFPNRERWSYTTAVELQEPVGGMTDCDFVLRGRRIFVLRERTPFDFVRLFSRSRNEALNWKSG